jgi:hypothetical protein
MPDRPYQTRGVEFALKKYCAYYMIDMSLGKTLMAIRFGQRVQKPVLVFAPLTPAYSVWPEEINKWWPEASWTILHGPQKNKRLFYKRNFYIINYEGIKWLYNTLTRGKIKVRPFTLVVDESSFIKDHSTKRFKMMKAMMPIFSPFRLCLSATPEPNGLHELWTQYYMLDEGARLGKVYTPFRDQHFEYTGPPKFKTIPRVSSVNRIYSAVEDITFRLDASDYLDLPELIFNDVKVKAPKAFHEIYKELNREGELDIGSGVKVGSDVAITNKLHQLCQGGIYDSNNTPHQIHKLKLEALLELVNAAQGKPMLVAVQYRFDVMFIEKVFGVLPKIVGGVPKRTMTNHIRRWNLGDYPVMLCHPQSLSHGVNMHKGGRILTYYGLPWGSYEQYHQLIGRLRRHGRVKPVIVNNILIAGTDDVGFNRILTQKGANQQDLLDYQREITKRRHL